MKPIIINESNFPMTFLDYKMYFKDKYLIGVISIGLCFLFTRYLWGYPGYMAFFTDDFFYYLKITQNFILSGNSSFNNIYLTNGYQPLYFVYLNILYLFSQFNKDLIFVLVSVTALISSIISYKLVLKISELFLPNINHRIFVAFLISFISILLFKGGMEVIFTIPLMLYFMMFSLKDNLFTSTESFFYGLISCALILSRLDTIIFVTLFTFFLLIETNFKQVKLHFYMLGFIPLILYLMINYYYFGTLVPISGLAKQLKSDFNPAIFTLQSLFSINTNAIFYSSIPVILNIFSIIFLGTNFSKISRKVKLLAFPSLLFPNILVLYYSIFSGWMLWSWYFYMYIPSTIVFFILIIKKLSFFSNRKFLTANVILLILWSLSFSITKNPNDYEEYSGALKIAQFERKNKGIFAMGDRAGFVGYMIESPIIQTEGIVMDKNYLTSLAGSNLNKLLKKYKVDYFIARNPQKKKNYWLIEEPYNYSGSTITSKGKLYQNPIDSVFINNWKNYIFKIK